MSELVGTVTRGADLWWLERLEYALAPAGMLASCFHLWDLCNILLPTAACACTPVHTLQGGTGVLRPAAMTRVVLPCFLCFVWA